MISTGLIRRIDDLGRVVIPPVIRKNMGISDGDALELFVDYTKGSVCFQKYNPMGEIGVILDQLAMRTEDIEKVNAQYKAEKLIDELRAIFTENS